MRKCTVSVIIVSGHKSILKKENEVINKRRVMIIDILFCSIFTITPIQHHCLCENPLLFLVNSRRQIVPDELTRVVTG